VIVENEGYAKQEMDFDTKSKANFIALNIPVIKIDTPVIESPTKTDEEKEGAKTSTEPIAVVRLANLSKVIVYQIMPDQTFNEVDKTHPVKDASLLEIKDLYFKFDSDEMRSGEEELKKVSSLLTNFQAINVEVIAYCDGFGSVEYNDALSKMRLDRVIAYLNKQGIASTRIKSSAIGSRQLFNSCLYSDCSVEENQQNRRVEFVLIPGK
jgi:outer membrane protein OmpA-like peptidoglycan-associated protein